MFTFKRALVAAAALLTFFFLLRSAHPSHPISPLLKNSPKPTGSYSDNKKIQDLPPPTTAGVKPPVKQSDAESKNNNQIAISQKSKPQIPLEQLKGQPLRKQLAYAFPYNIEERFPAYIWQTWKTTPADGDFPEEFRKAEASWTELHPSFVHEVLSDDLAASLVRHFFATIPEIVQAYNALPAPVLRADFFRYLILLARGGIYSDIDTTALKPAIDWIPRDVPRRSYGMVIGIEADPDRPDWQEWYSRRIQFCQWTIQAKAGHPVLVDIVATITEETLKMKKAGELNSKLMKSVVEFTGPALWTDVLFRYFNNPDFFDMRTSKGNISWEKFTGIKDAKKVGDVIVLPITSFSPGVRQMGAGEPDDPMAFVHHNFEGMCIAIEQ